MRRVDHGGVVDGGEVAVGQVKLVEPQQSRPDGFDLHVGKVLADAAVAAWRADERKGVEGGSAIEVSKKFVSTSFLLQYFQ